MNHDESVPESPYEMKFDIGTIKHLGLQMYSTLPPVIGELVANAWDANATHVNITIPDKPIDQKRSEIIIEDDGIGMSDKDVRERYLIIGRDRRERERSDKTPPPCNRKIMGRKGIGKFSAFGIAKEIDIESVQDKKISHFLMNYDELLKKEDERVIQLPQLSPTGTISKGTKITLRNIIKFKNRRIPIQTLRQGLARRFAVIGEQHNFEVVINGEPISIEERNFKSKLARDENGDLYLWEYKDTEVQDETGWTVSGWIGALDRASRDKDKKDKIDTGIVLMARGKLVQEPFVFDADVGQQFALSYLIGELHVEFTDEVEDTIATTRNSLVWDTEENTALKEWGKKEVNRIASMWADKRREDNERKLQEHPVYLKFKEQAGEIDKKREFKQADQLVRQLILKSLDKSPDADIEDFKPVVDMFIDFWKYDSFRDMAKNIQDAEIDEPKKLLNLFREWEILEAKEMMKVTEGRIMTIKQLDKFIKTNAKEVPTLHNFIKEFPWVIDPRWTLVANEHRYSDLLRETFPESNSLPEMDRRIDFLCVNEGTHLVVVEIKRPHSKVSMKELEQIEEYVNFVRSEIDKTTGPDRQYETATGYLLCGDLVDSYSVRGRRNNLEKAQIYIKRYGDLLEKVRRSHTEFLERYNQLQKKRSS